MDYVHDSTTGLNNNEAKAAASSPVKEGEARDVAEQGSGAFTPRPPPEEVALEIIFNKQEYDVTFDRHAKVNELKAYLTGIISEYLRSS